MAKQHWGITLGMNKRLEIAVALLLSVFCSYSVHLIYVYYTQGSSQGLISDMIMFRATAPDQYRILPALILKGLAEVVSLRVAVGGFQFLLYLPLTPFFLLIYTSWSNSRSTVSILGR
jgi:hypothetical protein